MAGTRQLTGALAFLARHDGPGIYSVFAGLRVNRDTKFRLQWRAIVANHASL
jgi:hypothetical protein